MKHALRSAAIAALATFASVARAQDPTPTPTPTPSPAPASAPPPAAATDDADADAEADPIDVFVGGARAKDTSGSAHVVSTKQLERFEYDDPQKVLVGVPGVYLRGEDGFGLRPNIGMRGALSDRSKKITLMEDGVLFAPAPYSAPAAYYFPLITRMAAVRVVKGPAAIAYGPHTVAGAIDLVSTAIPDEPSAMVDAAFGQYLSRKLHLRLGASEGKLGVVVEGVHLANDGFKRLDGAGGGGDTGFARNEWMVKGRYDVGQIGDTWNELEVKAGFSSELSNESYLGLTTADFEADPYRRYVSSSLDEMEWYRTSFTATHRMRRGNDLDLTTTAYRNDLRRTWNRLQGMRGAGIQDVLESPDDPRNQIFLGVLRGDAAASTDDEDLIYGPNDRAFVSQGLQTTLRWRPKTGPFTHRIEAGVRGHFDAIERLHTRRAYGIDRNEMVPTDDTVVTESDNEGSTLALAMHAIDAVTWKFLTITGGARVESIRGESEDALTGESVRLGQQVVLPGGGVFVALPADLGAFAGVYRGFSPIPPPASSSTEAEQSLAYEWGMRWSPRDFRLEVIGFASDYSNLANICTASTGCEPADLDQQFDGGTALVGGVEAYLQSEVAITEELRLPGRVA